MLIRFFKRVWQSLFGRARPTPQPTSELAGMPQLVEFLMPTPTPRLRPEEAVMFFRCEEVMTKEEADQVMQESRVLTAEKNRLPSWAPCMNVRNASQKDLDAHIKKYHDKKDETNGN